MMKKAGALGCSAVLAAAMPLMAQTTGPSSSVESYVVPVACGVEPISILTVGDSVNLKPDGVTPYRFVGIPDGTGALNNGDGTYTLWVNHELGSTVGITRAHGGIGAFVSEWVIDAATHTVISGQDLITLVYMWDSGSGDWVIDPAEAFGRFCSADLPGPEAFYNPDSGLGTQERIFTNGEENGNEGRAFGHVITGPNKGATWELPWLGKFSWENSVAHPDAGDATIVVGLDDSSPLGQVYVYIGTKTNSGSETDMAGLNNGLLYGIAVSGPANEDGPTGFGANSLPFSLVNLGDVSLKSGATLQAESEAATPTVTEFLRPEDGHWDPNNLSDFYFVTTHTFTNGKSRLWRLRFDDISNATAGGTIDLLLESDRDVVTRANGTVETPRMMDNMVVDGWGNVIIQEDVGNNVRLGKIWLYNIADARLELIAEHDADYFISGAPNFITQDEEASGVIDATDLIGPGWYIMTDQAHSANLDPELVEFGQLQAIYIPQALPRCEGDANGDGTVDPLDAGFVAARFGCQDSACDADCGAADQNHDGVVDPLDQGFVLARFGACL